MVCSLLLKCFWSTIWFIFMDYFFPRFSTLWRRRFLFLTFSFPWWRKGGGSRLGPFYNCYWVFYVFWRAFVQSISGLYLSWALNSFFISLNIIQGNMKKFKKNNINLKLVFSHTYALPNHSVTQGKTTVRTQGQLFWGERQTIITILALIIINYLSHPPKSTTGNQNHLLKIFLQNSIPRYCQLRFEDIRELPMPPWTPWTRCV